MAILAKSRTETLRFGERLGALLRPGDVVALNGPLGSGKTTLVTGIATGAKIEPGYSVTSPTFVYAHIYEGSLPVIHMDLYRIEDERNLSTIGLDEMLGGHAVAVVEWFEKFPQIWDGDRLEVRLSFGVGEERMLELTGIGSRGIMLAEQLESMN